MRVNLLPRVDELVLEVKWGGVGLDIMFLVLGEGSFRVGSMALSSLGFDRQDDLGNDWCVENVFVWCQTCQDGRKCNVPMTANPFSCFT